MAAYILFGDRGQAPADGGDHDGARHDHDGQDARAGNRACRRRWGRCRLEVERTDVNVIDAAGRGTGEGLQLALNVGAMLISFLALIALVNALLGLADLSLQQIFGWVFAPVAWSMGVPWRDAPTIGNLLGTRMALNEFVAYSQLGPLKDDARSEVVHDRDVRAVRLRQLQLDRHPDRRHRRAGAEPPPRSGASRPARDVRRHAGELHDGDDRRIPACERRRCTKARGARDFCDPCSLHRNAMDYYDQVKEAADAVGARVGEVPAIGDRARLRPRRLRRLARRCGVDAVRRAAALAGVARHRPRGRLVVGTVRGPHDRRAGGPVPRLRRATSPRPSPSPSGCSGCSASRR